jgi:hypothetical protein
LIVGTNRAALFTLRLRLKPNGVRCNVKQCHGGWYGEAVEGRLA